MASEKRQRLTTPPGIAVFEHVFEPHAFEDSGGKEKNDPKYSLGILYNRKEAKGLAELKAKCIEVLAEEFKLDEETVKARIASGKLQVPWRKFEEDDEMVEKYGEPFEAGKTLITLKTNKDNPPGIVNARAKPIMNRREFYSGAICRATYGVWAYEVGKNKGVSLLLNNVQKLGDGTRLAGRPSAEDDFDPVDDLDDEEDDADI